VIDLLDRPTAIARQVLLHAGADQDVAAGTVAGVEVTDHPDPLQFLEIAVHRGEIQWRPIQALRDLLCRDRTPRLEEEADDQPASRGDAKTVRPQHPQHRVCALKLKGGACRLEGQT
jgi:hypothetical protein